MLSQEICRPGSRSTTLAHLNLTANFMLDFHDLKSENLDDIGVSQGLLQCPLHGKEALRVLLVVVCLENAYLHCHRNPMPQPCAAAQRVSSCLHTVSPSGIPSKVLQAECINPQQVGCQWQQTPSIKLAS